VHGGRQVSRKPLDGRKAVRLDQLPQFRIDSIDRGEADVRLKGQLSDLRGVHDGRCWLYISLTSSLIGDLQIRDASRRSAEFAYPATELPPEVFVGASLPWVEAYWNAFHIHMVLSPAGSWQLIEFRPMAAARSHVDGWSVVRPLGPGDALKPDEERVPDAWDHEHCEICRSKIGVGGEPRGYRHQINYWLCEQCYREYAACHSVSFVNPTLQSALDG